MEVGDDLAPELQRSIGEHSWGLSICAPLCPIELCLFLSCHFPVAVQERQQSIS